MSRTRSASAHRKVLEAALELVAERGVDGTSMDAVAERSGVSKATIYKHWADKDALLLEMLATASGLRSRPTFDSGDIRADMTAVLAHRAPENQQVRDRILPHFVAYSARNQAFGIAWRKTMMEPPQRDLRRLITRGIERGELSGSLDVELALGLLLGPMLYWHIFLKDQLPQDFRPLAEGVVDAVWTAFGATSRPRRA